MSGHEGFSDVVVVGASLAGLRCCQELRRSGFDGTIAVVSEESELFYDRPPLSKRFITGQLDEAQTLLVSKDQIGELGLDVYSGAPAKGLDVDGHALQVGGDLTLAYRQLVIATGLRPRTLPVLEGVPRVLVLRNRGEGRELRSLLEQPGKRLLVVGGGFLGMEVAASATKQGAAVTLVEALEAPLLRVLGPMVGNHLARVYAEKGVDVRVGTSVVSASWTGSHVDVELRDGILEVDAVLVAIGAVPATEWLVGSTVALDDGVVCDDYLRAAPDVFAVGDVARFPHPVQEGLVRLEHWTNASEQGTFAGRVIAGATAGGRFDTVPYFWSDVIHTKIQSLGFPEAVDDVDILEGTLDSGRFAACYSREGKVRGIVTFGLPKRLFSLRPVLEARGTVEDAQALLD